jgi:hypothetical protein
MKLYLTMFCCHPSKKIFYFPPYFSFQPTSDERSDVSLKFCLTNQLYKHQYLDLYEGLITSCFIQQITNMNKIPKKLLTLSTFFLDFA